MGGSFTPVRGMTREQAAAARRAAASSLAQRAAGGMPAQQRLMPTGVGASRSLPFPGQIRAALEPRNGKELYHVSGYATVFERAYPMWDMFGEYEEVVKAGAADNTLAADPDVAFLVNHKGVTMARTRNGTLELGADTHGMFQDAWLNPERQDVKDLIIAIEDQNVTEMSFAFMIPDGGGWWSDDFTTFEIRQFDIDRGDVSAVNYGANPYTDIASRAAEILDSIDRLPQGAARVALERLMTRPDMVERSTVTPQQQRERIEATAGRVQGGDRPSIHVQRLQHRVAYTADRMVRHAQRTGAGVQDLPTLRLPWYEVRDAGDGEGPADTATVFIYDEIGGSFGVSAEDFARDLEQIDARSVLVRINSPGGSVFDATAIYNSLNHHDARIITYIDALAASAATVVAMAGDEIVVMPGGQMMVHDASNLLDGNAAEHASDATFLDRQSDNIADIYRMRAGGDIAEWRQLMLDETWLFGPEAVAMRLADRVEEPPKVNDPELVERMARSHDLTGRYRYAGRRAAPAPRQRRAELVDRDAIRASIDRHATAAESELAERVGVAAGANQATGRSLRLIEQLLDDD